MALLVGFALLGLAVIIGRYMWRVRASGRRIASSGVRVAATVVGRSIGGGENAQTLIHLSYTDHRGQTHIRKHPIPSGLYKGGLTDLATVSLILDPERPKMGRIDPASLPPYEPTFSERLAARAGFQRFANVAIALAMGIFLVMLVGLGLTLMIAPDSIGP